MHHLVSSNVVIKFAKTLLQSRLSTSSLSCSKTGAYTTAIGLVNVAVLDSVF